MAKAISYKVIERFSKDKLNGLKITPQIQKCLTTFAVGDVINVPEYAKAHHDHFTKNPAKNRTNYLIVMRSFDVARKLGLLKEVSDKPISFENFCRLESVAYFKEQLRASKRKNTTQKFRGDLSSGQRLYVYNVWNFSNWLSGKEFSFKRLVQTGIDTFKQEQQQIRIKHIEHFLHLYQEQNSTASDFIRIIKMYLLSDTHQDKRASTVNGIYFAIKSYFEKNDSMISFRFDASVKYQTKNDDDQSILTLDDFHKILTVGQPTITQKAMLLCKFHRGLDTSTLVDRFNFEAWQQLTKWFGTENFAQWDLSMCPVPIKLTRIKVSYTHTGFLDRDAVQSIVDYLNFRESMTGKKMQVGQPLFLTKRNQPVTDTWVRRSFQRCAKNAGLQQRLEQYILRVRYNKDSHELRDLLKSILITSGTRYDVADHCIGHKPKDSYEKQAQLFPEDLRMEYSKATEKLNIFSNVSSYLNSSKTVELQQKQIRELKTKIATMQREKNELDDFASKVEAIKMTTESGQENYEFLLQKILELEKKINN